VVCIEMVGRGLHRGQASAEEGRTRQEPWATGWRDWRGVGAGGGVRWGGGGWGARGQFVSGGGVWGGGGVIECECWCWMIVI